MSSTKIQQSLIHKLGHKIEEIRLRALKNIASKLEYGCLYNCDLTASKELLIKLFEWFSFERCSEQETVLQLIYKIFTSETGISLIKLLSPEVIISDLQQVKSCLSSGYFPLLNKIILYVETHIEEPSNLVPPLNLSQNDADIPKSVDIQTSGTSFDIYIYEPNVEMELQHGISSKQSQSTSSNISTSRFDTNSKIFDICIPHSLLGWQPLVAPDRHVLSSIEHSLENATDTVMLLHSCKFFTDVLLQDFPAEIFLQRPSIVKVFHSLLNSTQSTKVADVVIAALQKLSELLHIRVKYYSDPSTFNFKQEKCIEEQSGLKNSLNGLSSFRTTPCKTDSDQKDYYSQATSEATDDLESDNEDSVLLQIQQLTLPHFCIQTLYYALVRIGAKPSAVKNLSANISNKENMNGLIKLIATLVKLTHVCIKPEIWNYQSDQIIQEVTNQIMLLFNKLADVLEHFRLLSLATDLNPNIRVSYLQLLCLTRMLLIKIVPKPRSYSILPTNLKNSIANCLVDAAFLKLYPNIHEDLFLLLTDSSDGHGTFLNRYKDINMVCNSMDVAVKFIRHGISGNDEDVVLLMLSVIPSLEYHKNMSLIKNFCEILVNKYPKWKESEKLKNSVEELIVSLLGHNDSDVKLAIYNACHLYVTNVLGIDHVTKSGPGRPGECLLFLWSSGIFIEIICHGLNSENAQIQRYAEEIIHYILKAKFFVTPEIWNTILVAIIPAFPLLQCYANKSTALGRSILKMVDPDIAESIQLPSIEVIKGNLRMLFSKNHLVRGEALSRLTWILTSEENSDEKLPALKTLREPLLSTICIFDNPINLKNLEEPKQFYQLSSMIQVLELLSSNGIEPTIRKSAITQLSAMLEDPALQETFVTEGGVSLLIGIFKNSLIEKEFENYPDNVIPAIRILKNLCFYKATLRQELSLKKDLYLLITRALFLFSGDESFRSDAAVLLCLLLFSDFILTTGQDKQISVVHIIANSLSLPITCKTHWRISQHARSSLADILLNEESSAATLRIHWNIAWCGGLQELLNLEQVPNANSLTPEQLAEFNGNLRLTKFDLASLKYSSTYYCCQMYLYDIQNASSHQAVMESIYGLTAFMSLRKLASSFENIDNGGNILNLPWEFSLGRFLASPPSSVEDIELLIVILNFLRTHMKIFKKSNEKSCWITSILKDPNHCLPKLLHHGGNETNNLNKNLNKELLMLITESATIEQRYLDIGMLRDIRNDKKQKGKKRCSGTWAHIVQSITENLNFNDTEHFYNLAFLDWLLNCLVQITATLGWSENVQCHLNTQELRGSLIGCLTELVGAFHCGKGPAAATSFMGLSITRNSILTMNHLLCEMQNLTERGWEKFWLCETGDINGSLQWLGTLWTSRDVILRAATLQLLAGLASSQRGATEVILGLRMSCSGGVWGGALSILLDHNEASAVREQAVNLLTNLTSHSTPINGTNCSALTLCYGPDSSVETSGTVESLLALLEKYNFYTELDSILSCLNFDVEIKKSSISELSQWKMQTETAMSDTSSRSKDYMLVYTQKLRSVVHSGDIDSESSSSKIESVDGTCFIVTPSLVKSLSWFIVNLLNLDPDAVVNELNRNMLIRSFFKCLTLVNFNVKDSRSLVLYMDVLEMCAAICTLLTKAVTNSCESHSTVLHLRNCLYTLISTLNPTLYYSTSNHLLYLRNRLWSRVYNFLTALLVSDDGNTCYRDKGCKAITIALNEVGYINFMEALCESISGSSPELQHAAISLLTSLLRLEAPQFENFKDYDAINIKESSPSLQVIFDTVRITYSTDSCLSSSNIENIRSSNELENELVKLTDVKAKFRKISVLKTNNDSNTNTNSHINDNIDNIKSMLDKNSLIGYKKNTKKKSKETDKESNKFDDGTQIVGTELCQILIHLYDLYSVKSTEKPIVLSKRKSAIISALTSLLCVSSKAKKFALNDGFLEKIITQLQELHVKLSLESVESIRRATDKKRVCPILNDISCIFKLLTNFMLGNERVKLQAVSLGLADLIHKLWNWINFQQNLLIEVLRMLCTFTTECQTASQSITLTSAVAGVGPRKTPTTMSLLHCILHLIGKEMDMVSRSHDLKILTYSFHLLQNCCQAYECRVLISKSNFFQHLNRLHPAITKQQKPWESIELLWLEFLETLTFHPEGQVSVAKSSDTLELIMALTSSSHEVNKMTALAILRNITFYQANRTRLLSSGEFLQILNSKLSSGSIEEKCTCITIIWSLAANNQKAKLILKTSGLEYRLQEVLKQWKLGESNLVPKEQLNHLQYIIEMLREGR